MRYSRIGLWAAAAVVAVAATTTAVTTATGGPGREVLTEDGVADALAAAQVPSAPEPRSAPAGAPDASANDSRTDGDERLLQGSAGDVVASCDKDELTIHSIAPKPGYRMLMVEVDRKSLRTWDGWWPTKTERAGTIRVRLGSGGRIAVVFDRAGSEVSTKVVLSCVDGEPTAKESQVVKNFGAGKG